MEAQRGQVMCPGFIVVSGRGWDLNWLFLFLFFWPRAHALTHNVEML